VRMDKSTSLVTKGRAATPASPSRWTLRALLCLTLMSFLKVWMPLIFWQQFEYEHVHLFCARCGCLVHRPVDCRSSQATLMTHPVDASNISSFASREDVMALLTTIYSSMMKSRPPLPWIMFGSVARTLNSHRIPSLRFSQRRCLDT